MKKIKILIADNSYLIRKGLKAITLNNVDFQIIGEAESSENLYEKLLLNQPNVLIIDYSSSCFSVAVIQDVHNQFPKVKILAITNPLDRQIISNSLDNGVLSHLLKDCGKEEIVEAIYETAKGKKFFCGKIVDLLMNENTIIEKNISTTNPMSCNGLKLSEREIEIIQNVAAGFSNKEIAKRLFLSIHTVTTHRKNIMSKLGVKNTAGLMMYAIRQNILESTQILYN